MRSGIQREIQGPNVASSIAKMNIHASRYRQKIRENEELWAKNVKKVISRALFRTT